MLETRKSIRKALPLIYKLVEYDMAELRQFVTGVESRIETQSKRLSNRIARQTNGLNQVQRERLFEAEQSELYTLDEAFAQWARRSVILCIYGVFEDAMKTFAMFAKGDGLTMDEFKKLDKRGREMKLYLNDCHQYLTKKVHVAENVFGQDWKFLDGVRALRNVIAHENGQLAHDHKRERHFISSHYQLSLRSAGRLNIKCGFSETLLDAVERCLTRIGSDLVTKALSEP